MRYRLLLGCLLAMSLGCSSTSLLVRHQDPSQPVAEVWIDGRRSGEVLYGEERHFEMAPGHHHLKVVARDTDVEAWNPKGGGWDVTLEDEATLTLLTPRSRRARGRRER